MLKCDLTSGMTYIYICYNYVPKQAAKKKNGRNPSVCVPVSFRQPGSEFFDPETIREKEEKAYRWSLGGLPAKVNARRWEVVGLLTPLIGVKNTIYKAIYKAIY